MKLKKIQLFLILLTTLLAGAAGLVITEGLANKEDVDTWRNSSRDNFDSESYKSNYRANKAGFLGRDPRSETVNTVNRKSPFTTLTNDFENDSNVNKIPKMTYSPNISSSTSNSMPELPAGITRKQIPKGDDDLYILKSEVVPPVCPACPQSSSCPRQKPCRPCPPCGRCPEPAFECKKVPNYSSSDNQYLPRPVLNDFSSFGM